MSTAAPPPTPSPPPPLGAGVPVTVVVATRDRRDGLLRTLARLEALPERPRIVVVDNGSSDGTADAVGRAHPAVTVVALHRNRAAAARTVGVAEATTPYVAFSDDDSWWAPGALAEAVARLRSHPRLGLLAGRVLVGADERLDPTSALMARSPLGPVPDLPGVQVLGFLACASVVRRDAYLQAGGFIERFGVGGEEEVLALDLAAAGWGLAYVDEVVAHHHPSPSRDAEARRRVEARNTLWAAWLRRPPVPAARRTARVLAAATRSPAVRAGAVHALAALPWVVAHRRTVPPAVEAQARRLERAGSGAPPPGTPRA